MNEDLSYLPYVQIGATLVAGLLTFLGVLMAGRHSTKRILDQINVEDKTKASRAIKDKIRISYEEAINTIGKSQEILMKILNSNFHDCQSYNSQFQSEITNLSKMNLFASARTASSLSKIIVLANGLIGCLFKHKFELKFMDDRLEEILKEHDLALTEVNKLNTEFTNKSINDIDFKCKSDEYLSKCEMLLKEHHELLIKRFKFDQEGYGIWIKWMNLINDPFNDLINSMRSDLDIPTIDFLAIAQENQQSIEIGLGAVSDFLSHINLKVDEMHQKKDSCN